jgi:hypothetical protein
MSPAFPLADPVDNEAEPEFPPVVDPVKSETDPVAALLSAEEIRTLPLSDARATPLVTDILPPV